MRSFCVVKCKVVSQPQCQVSHAAVSLQIDVLMLETAPESLHEDIVQRPASAIDADADAFTLEHIGEDLTGKLHPLVAVEDLWSARVLQGIFETVDTEGGVQCVAQLPAQDFAAVPVDDHDQIGKAMRQANVGDVGAPDLVGACDGHASQQIRIDLVLWVRLAGVGAWRHPGQAHQSHQPLYPFAVDVMAFALQEDDHPATAVKGAAGVFLVHQAAQHQVGLVRFDGTGPGIDR